MHPKPKDPPPEGSEQPQHGKRGAQQGNHGACAGPTQSPPQPWNPLGRTSRPAATRTTPLACPMGRTGKWSTLRGDTILQVAPPEAGSSSRPNPCIRCPARHPHQLSPHGEYREDARPSSEWHTTHPHRTENWAGHTSRCVNPGSALIPKPHAEPTRNAKTPPPNSARAGHANPEHPRNTRVGRRNGALD